MKRDDRSWTVRARALARALKHTPDRILHRARRPLLERRIRRLGLPRSVLFVCHGNICRSPYAQHAFFRRLPPELQEYMFVVSAGFVGPDRPTPEHGIAAASGSGIDLTSHRSQQLSTGLVRLMDLIVVMDGSQQRRLCSRFGADKRRIVVLGDLDPASIDTREVRDPFRQPLDVFASSYARIDRCVGVLLDILGGADRSAAAVRAPQAEEDPTGGESLRPQGLGGGRSGMERPADTSPQPA